MLKVPKEWEVVRLGDVILKIGDGGTPSTKIKDYFNGDIPWVTIEDIKREIYDTRRHLSELGLKNSSAKLWPKGTIIFSFGASIGKVGIAKVELCTKQGIAGIVPNSEKIYNEFLYYVLLKEADKIKKIGQSMGSTIKEVRPSKLVKLIEFGLPPLSEQHKIAEILSTVDKAIEKVDETIVKTERLKKGLMQELLTKGIGHTEFKDTEIGRIPKEWEVVRLEDITLFIKDGTHNPPKRVENGIPLLSARNIINGKIVRFEDDTYITEEDYIKMHSKYEIQKGDVLLTIVGTIGNSAVVDIDYKFTVQRSVAIIHPNTRVVDSYYLHYTFQTSKFKQQLVGYSKLTTQAGVYLKDLSRLKIPLPPLSEQKKIAEILSTVDKKLELEKKRKEKLERVKKGLMNDLLTGRKRVKV